MWLTESTPMEVEYTDASLESILFTMERFVEDNDDALLFLDGIEYLSSKISFEAVMAFCRQIVDMVSGADAIFVIVISPEALGIQEAKSLEREMEVVK